MDCPLRKRLVLIKDGDVTEVFLPCIQDKCVAWDSTRYCCGGVSVARAFFALIDVLTDIRDRLPNKLHIG